jgi:hypothetical protein
VAIRGHEVTSVEDEYFANADGELALPEDEVRSATEEGLVDGGLALGGPGALLAALGQARTGRMGDIVATIQGEQDQIIRSPLAGVLLVQGGPGTGKTAVALHRAAYLLFTYRASLERQGVLVVGPNPLFLNYIENVLPSLGESGVTLSTISGLVTNVEIRGEEDEEVDQLKGDIRMSTLIARALRTRQRPLRADVQIPIGRAIMVLKSRYARVVDPEITTNAVRPSVANSRIVSPRSITSASYAKVSKRRAPWANSLTSYAPPPNSKKPCNGSGRASVARNFCTTSSAHQPCCAPRARGSSATPNSNYSRESVRSRSRRSNGPRRTRR